MDIKNELNESQSKPLIDIAGDLEEEKKFAKELEDKGQVSETLLRDRRASLNFQTEASLYLDRIERSTEDRETIAELSRGIELGKDTRTITVISAYVAETGLRETLLPYINTQLSSGKHHIVVFLNAGPKLGTEEYQRELDSRTREIAVVQKSMPDVTITAVSKQFTTNAVLGKVRGLVGDSIITSAVQAGLEDPILISNDADQLDFGPDYLSAIQSAYDTNEKLDATGGPVYFGGYGPDGKNYYGDRDVPEAWLGDSFLQASDEVVRNGEAGTKPVFYTSGANSTVRLAALCAMGGYDYNLGFKEEVEIGRRAKAMRMEPEDSSFYYPEHFQFLENAYVVTSPRRSLLALVNGKTLIEQWDDFDANMGSDLITSDLVDIYEKTSEFLQASDIQSALQGDALALKKLKDRIQISFINAAEYDLINNEERLKALANNMGITITESQFSEKGLVKVEIDWNNSEVLQKIYQLVKKKLRDRIQMIFTNTDENDLISNEEQLRTVEDKRVSPSRTSRFPNKIL